MRTSVSHLAINNSPDELSTISELGISGLEIVLSKIGMNHIFDFCKIVNSSGLIIESAQSILYNSGVNDLTDDSFTNYLDRIIPVYEKIGVKTLVLGSPAQRKTADLEKLLYSFTKADNLLSKTGITLCIEPNCRLYGGEYFYDIQSIVDFIEDGAFSNIKTMVDTHNLIAEGIDPSQTLIDFFDKIHHIHVSEKGLGRFIKSEEHEKFAKTIKSLKYSNIVTYESNISESLVDDLSNFVKIFN